MTRLVRDTARWRYEATGYPYPGECRRRVYLRDDDVIVVVLTELADNPGVSITNAAEAIHGLLFQAIATPFRQVEHYPPNTDRSDTYSEVTVRRGRAQWTHLSGEAMAVLLPGVDLR